MKTKTAPIETHKKVVFAAMSKKSFFLREHIIKFILERGHTPTCAFMMFSYFLLDTVDRLALINANNELIRRSDELWVFGEVSDGVAEEIKLARSVQLPVRFFSWKFTDDYDFVEIAGSEVVYERKK
jgi:hypothetical protein